MVSENPSSPKDDLLEQKSPFWSGMKSAFKRFEFSKFFEASTWGLLIGGAVELALGMPLGAGLIGAAAAAGVAAGIEDVAKNTYHRVTTSVRAAKEHNLQARQLRGLLGEEFRQHDKTLQKAAHETRVLARQSDEIAGIAEKMENLTPYQFENEAPQNATVKRILESGKRPVARMQDLVVANGNETAREGASRS